MTDHSTREQAYRSSSTPSQGAHFHKRRREDNDNKRTTSHNHNPNSSPPSSPTPKRHRSPSPPTTTTSQKQQAANTFVWRKKIEQDKKKGRVTTKETEAERLKTLQIELIEAKRQREIRDKEKLKRDEEIRQEVRRRDQEQHRDDKHAESSFEGRQYFIRQAIRLRNNRPTTIDRIAKFVRLDLVDFDFENDGRDVIHIIEQDEDEDDEGLEGIEDELDYIPDFPNDYDSDVFNMKIRLEFWSSVKEVIRFKVNNNASSVHGEIVSDVEKMIKGRDVHTLIEMEREIEGKLNGPAFGEIDFWTEALKQIRLSLATHRLLSCINILKADRQRRHVEKAIKNNNQQQHQQQLSSSSSTTRNKERELLVSEINKGMDQGEQQFNDEISHHHHHHHRHQTNGDNGLRKPLYYNRVHTGYNWSKYNRTHYDHDNPPPKTVQGYKFNIFYPDLQNMSITPIYSIKKTDNPDVAIITFKAGKPYDDIAFKIVNRPWERSHKRGYRCCFDRGVLQLWFYFQHYRYCR